MHQRLLLSSVALAVTFLGACATTPDTNSRLESARSELRSAQNGGVVAPLAPLALKQATDALAVADAAAARHAPVPEVDHLAYIASQRVAVAREVAAQKTAEAAVADAGRAQDRLRLAARTQEADAARRDADTARGQSEDAKRQADASLAQAAAAQQAAADAQARTAQLQNELKELNAKPTDRGLVITIGDVLFDTDRAELKAGAQRNVEKLGSFLKEHPQRKARIEGFTDSTGGDAHNLMLSAQRADAVRTALVDQGMDRGRLESQGYGKAFPVAGNDSASGRQLNRRVEIILSEDNGVIAPR